MTCPTCRSTRYGCTAGRCFGPASAADVEKPKLQRQPDPRGTGARPLEVRSKVLAAEIKRGRGGGLYWHVVLACGCEQIQWAGSAAHPRKRPGPDEHCIGCSPTPSVPCAGGCQRAAERLERYERPWVFCREGWFCPACWELLGPAMRRRRAGRDLGSEDAEVETDCSGSCGASASEAARYETGWVYYLRRWFCPRCVEVILCPVSSA